MKYNEILIRYGELTTKGKNRMHFIRCLESNLKNILDIEPITEFDRMFIDYSEKNLNGLNYLFGISSFSPVIKVSTDIDIIKTTVDKLVGHVLKNKEYKTFKVITKRNWKEFKQKSNEINMELGGQILDNYPELKVDIKNPELKINIEIRRNFTYIFHEKIKGPGGYPVGINGRVLMMLSGGIDSPVATYNLMKRGLKVDFLSFITPPHTDDVTVNKIKDIIKLMNKYQHASTLYLSKYTDLMYLIEFASKESYRITLMRRSFYRIASKLATKYKYLAIANGENLGQVASQTLESINTIQAVTNTTVFRPLLTADKQETIDLGKKIGTYKISIIQANESCELFAPKKPIIKPRVRECIALENELPNLLENEEKLINNIEKIEIN